MYGGDNKWISSDLKSVQSVSQNLFCLSKNIFLHKNKLNLPSILLY